MKCTVAGELKCCKDCGHNGEHTKKMIEVKVPHSNILITKNACELCCGKNLTHACEQSNRNE